MSKYKYNGYWIEDSCPALVWKVGTKRNTAVKCHPPHAEAIIDSGAINDIFGQNLGQNESVSGGHEVE